MKDIRIGNHLVGAAHQPFIIAEMSGNHNHSLERALALVESAAKTGAQAFKLQTYTADSMTIDLCEGEFYISDVESPWFGESLYSLYQKAYTPWEWHEPIFQRCRKLGLTPFSTPFDADAVDFLEELDVPCYKIASFESIDLQLIRKVASTGKPMIISTGMATVAELDETVNAAKSAGCNDLILLKCTSSYPASPTNSNTRTIPHLKNLFDVQVGLSDHTLGVGAAVAAIALGATVVEKHFTLSRADGGVDAAFSMEPAEMAQLVTEAGRAWQSLGKVHYGPVESEESSMIFRRSLYIVEPVKRGEAFSLKNVKAIRPGYGLSPKYLDIVVGATAREDIPRGTPVSWDLITGEGNL